MKSHKHNTSPSLANRYAFRAKAMSLLGALAFAGGEGVTAASGAISPNSNSEQNAASFIAKADQKLITLASKVETDKNSQIIPALAKNVTTYYDWAPSKDKPGRFNILFTAIQKGHKAPLMITMAKDVASNRWNAPRNNTTGSAITHSVDFGGTYASGTLEVANQAGKTTTYYEASTENFDQKHPGFGTAGDLVSGFNPTSPSAVEGQLDKSLDFAEQILNDQK